VEEQDLLASMTRHVGGDHVLFMLLVDKMKGSGCILLQCSGATFVKEERFPIVPECCCRAMVDGRLSAETMCADISSSAGFPGAKTAEEMIMMTIAAAGNKPTGRLQFWRVPS
jgi:hypothetical protein